MKLLDKEVLLKVFSYMNGELEKNQIKLDMTMYGGAAMAIMFNSRPSTRDVDCVFNSVDVKHIGTIIDIVGSEFGLADDWLNHEIKKPLNYLTKEDTIILLEYSNLTIRIPVKEQLLAMKILASRNEPAKDFVDAFLLCQELEIVSKKQLLETIKPYLSLNLIGERQNIFIQYLGEDLGYNDWK